MRYFLLLLWGSAHAQNTPADVIALPSSKTEATVDLKVTPFLAANATINPLPFVDANGQYLRPQPIIKAAAKDGLVRLDLSAVHFWGTARLQLQIIPGGLSTYTFRRGPAVTPNKLDAHPGAPLQVWIYNYENDPLSIRWRINSSIESICGLGPKTTCSKSADWGTLTIPPNSSKPIEFSLPSEWFATDASDRNGQLEIATGAAENPPVLTVPIDFMLKTSWFQWVRVRLLWTSDFFGLPVDFWPYIGLLLSTIFWVAVGAAILMAAQIVIPGYRRCAKLENQIELLEDRFKSIGSRVGTRLYSRCSRDIKFIRSSLLMKEVTGWVNNRALQRILLFANPTELIRFEGLIAGIETRIRLTEKLDEARLEQLSDPAHFIPITIQQERDQKIAAVEKILSRQYISQSDSKTAEELLDAASSVDTLRRDFPDKLEGRIVRLRKELACAPWFSVLAGYWADLPTTKELFDGTCAVPPGGWSDSAIFQRDLDAVRLELLYQLIALPHNNAGTIESRGRIISLLQAGSAPKLNEARNLICQVSEGIFEADIRKAFLEKDWDTWYEPDKPTVIDVLSVSLRFRNERLNRAAARDRFQCYWLNQYEDQSKAPGKGLDAASGEQYESGWDIQLMPKYGVLRLQPEIYHDGKNVANSVGDGKAETKAESKTAPLAEPVYLPVSARPLVPITNRLIRGLMDSAVTAIVPVVTVAVTQTQTNTDLAWTTLVSLGVTSQAIRAAIVPESVNPPAPAAPPTTTAPPVK